MLILTEAYIKPKALDLATVEVVEVVDAVFSTKVNIHKISRVVVTTRALLEEMR